MIRIALVCALLSGCTNVQVLPLINPTSDDVNCCVIYAEWPPTTRASLSVSKSESGIKVKSSVKWKF